MVAVGGAVMTDLTIDYNTFSVRVNISMLQHLTPGPVLKGGSAAYQAMSGGYTRSSADDDQGATT